MRSKKIKRALKTKITRAKQGRDRHKEKIIVEVDRLESATEVEEITHAVQALTEVDRTLKIIIGVLALTGKSTREGTRDVTTAQDLGRPKENTIHQVATEKRIVTTIKVSLIDTMKVGDAD